MWDGIENAGWGVHDPNATTWKDLSGNGYDINLTANAIVNSESMEMAKSGIVEYGLGRVYCSVPMSNATLESCVTPYYSGTASEVLVTIGPITTGRNNPCIIVKTGKNFEWGYDYDNLVEVFKDGQAVTITATRLNGIVNGSTAMTARATDTWGLATNYIAIGGDSRHSNYPAKGYKFHNVRIYSRALTAEEIAHNYEIDRERFNLP